MKSKILLVISILSFAFTCCNSGSSTSSKSTPTYEATKTTLEEQEKANPTSFLTLQATYRKNLIGDWVVEGTIANSATVASFKDAVLSINYYSKTGSVISTVTRTVYEYFPKGKSKSFKIKLTGPSGTSSLGCSIESASCSD